MTKYQNVGSYKFFTVQTLAPVLHWSLSKIFIR